MEDFTQKKEGVELHWVVEREVEVGVVEGAVKLKGNEPVDRDSIFEPRSEEDFEEKESKEIIDPKKMLISEVNGEQEEEKEMKDPKEMLISEITNMQKTLNDLMEKAGKVHGDVQRLESENEVKVFLLFCKIKGQTKNLQIDQTSRC